MNAFSKEMARLLANARQEALGNSCPEVSRVRKVMRAELKSTSDSPSTIVPQPEPKVQPEPVPVKKSPMDLFREINQSRLQRGEMAPTGDVTEGPKRGVGMAMPQRFGRFGGGMAMPVRAIDGDSDSEDEDFDADYD